MWNIKLTCQASTIGSVFPKFHTALSAKLHVKTIREMIKKAMVNVNKRLTRSRRVECM